MRTNGARAMVTGDTRHAGIAANAEPEDLMSTYLGGAVLTIECPECGNKMKQTVEYAQTSPELQCSECRSMLKLDGERLRLAVEQVDAAVKALNDGGVKKIPDSYAH
jgi:ribosomal protein S27E